MDSFMSDGDFNVECPVAVFLSTELASALQIGHAVLYVGQAAPFSVGCQSETGSIIVVGDADMPAHMDMQRNAGRFCMF